jgi:elongation factor P
MSTISSNDFKTGMTLSIDNGLWTVIEFLHVKPGKGSAFVRTKLKNVVTGQVNEKTFRAGEKLESAHLEKSEIQYLFGDGKDYTFMDNSTYEQITLTKAQIGDGVKYLKEGTVLSLLMHGNTVVGAELPNFVELIVSDTPPNERGNTAQGGTKSATLESGAEVQVPFFVEIGTKVRIDTRTNQYLDRA